MENNDVIKIRDILRKATVTVRGGDGKDRLLYNPIHVVCDNSLNIQDNGYNVIWDDKNFVLYYFLPNTPQMVYNSPSSGMSFGNRGMMSGAVIVVDYSEIQNMRLELNEEAYGKLLNAIKAQGANPSQEALDWINHEMFVKPNAAVAIQRKRMYSYTTQTLHNSEEEKRKYDDLDEYDKTVHP